MLKLNFSFCKMKNMADKNKHIFLVLFCFLTEEAYSHGGLRNPFMLAWVTNMLTSPDLYIEFSALTRRARWRSRSHFYYNGKS